MVHMTFQGLRTFRFASSSARKWLPSIIVSTAAPTKPFSSLATEPNIRSPGVSSPSAHHSSGIEDVDVLVVGAGMVGAAVACGLATRPITRSLRVAVVDGQPLGPGVADLIASSAFPDPRVVAISPASVWEGGGRGHVRYDAQEVDTDVLGYVVENQVLVAALQTKMKEMGGVNLIAPATVSAITWPSPQEFSTGGLVGVELSDGRRLRTRLLVGADGGHSQVRQLAGFRTVGWAYNQRAVIATVETDTPHTTAWQRFLPTGPLALLPMGTSHPGPEPKPGSGSDSGSGSGSSSGSVRHYSNIVWSTSEEDAVLLQSMSDAAFISRLNAAFRTDYSPPPSPPSPPASALARTLAEALLPPSFATLLDTIPTGRKGLKRRGPKWKRGAFELPPWVTGVGSGRLSFPLRLSHSGKYVSERMALVGDSAHTVHPLAGQGVNLGLADADALVQVVGRGLATGRDIGEVHLLQEYEKSRTRANLAMMAVLDGLQRTFSAQWEPFSLARNLGLDFVNNSGLVKRQMMRFAMGLDEKK